MSQRVGRGYRNPRQHGEETPWTVHSGSTRILQERGSVMPVAPRSKEHALHAAQVNPLGSRVCKACGHQPVHKPRQHILDLCGK